MAKSPIRTGLYSPPGATLPYIALVLTPEGKQILKTFPTRKEAREFTKKYEGDYLTRFSKVGSSPKFYRDSTATKKKSVKKKAAKKPAKKPK